LESKFFNLFERLSKNLLMFVPVLCCRWTSLDQFGRIGTLNHMIRKKAAASESGLNTLKDIQAKVLYLLLTAEGVKPENLL
jgi:hypothetical protein